MSVDRKIRDALIDFGDPVENAVYQGKEDQYYTFNYSTMGTDFGDNEPGHERCLVQIHLFAPLKVNVTKRVRETKKALLDAGFTWPSTENASDDSGRHIIFECECVEGMEDGEV